LGAVPGFAQDYRASGGAEFAILGIRDQLVQAPDYGSVVPTAGSRAQTLRRNWLRVEVEFESTPEWADDVAVRYYVVLGTGRDQRLFVGEMTHMNVARGRKHFSAMFMPPSALERYGRGKPEAVAVQLRHQGKLVAEASVPPAQRRWWETMTPIEGQLLDPQFTPWSVVAAENYDLVKRVR
jgi:hypothetical protein